MKISVIFLLVFGCVFNSFSQDPALTFPTGGDTLPNVKNSLSFTGKPGKVTVYKDERITKIEEFVRAGETTLDGVKIDGYRVMIFFDMSKSVAESQKAYFISLYPDHKTYMDYSAPNYRVSVGNFRTELEAECLKQELLMMFPTAIVVPDKIQLPVIAPAAP
jgi:hypothetical protein